MKKTILISGVLALLLVSCNNSSRQVPADTEWPEITAQSKPFTRWWWLGNAVDTANLSRMMQQFSDAGIGGVEIASIYGVQGQEAREIPYLSTQWLDMYQHTVDQAARLGMIVDLTNGTGWPFGGPTVSVEDASSRYIIETYPLSGGQSFDGKLVYYEPVRRPGQATPPARGSATYRPEEPHRVPAAGTTLECLMAYSAAGEIVERTDRVAADRTLDWTAPAGEWTLYAIYNGKSGQMVKRMAPGGEGYVLDHLNREAVNRYFTWFDEAFKTRPVTMPHMFFNDSYEVSNSSWTPGFLNEFEARRGYKLENYLPQLLANDTTELSRRVVTDYRLTINDLLVDNFITPWIDWVHGHGALVRNQSHGSPGNILDIYAMVDQPEIETFGRTDFDIPLLQKDSVMRYNDSNPTVLKFASSGANLTAKPLTSSETLTWLTEHFRTPLSIAKPELDLLFVNGVNQVIFHGTPYSPDDAAWPGWLFYASVNMSPTNSIWRDAPAMFSYIARSQSFLQSGRSDNESLVYYPMYDFWNDIRKTPYTSFSIHGLVDLLGGFNDTVMEILEAGYGLDYISDQFIESLSFDKGELVTPAGVRYRTLIVPATRYMPEPTMAAIVALAEQGATVVFTENYPNDVPGLQDLEARRAKMTVSLNRLPEADFTQVATHSFGRGRIITGTQITPLMEAAGLVAETMGRDFGAQYIRRRTDDGHIYFVAMLQNRPIDGWVTLAKEARSVMLFDPMTGKKGLAQVRTQDGRTQVYLQLRPDESIILKTFEKKALTAEPWLYTTPETGVVTVDGDWTLSFVESEPAIAGTFDVGTLGSWTELPDPNAKINVGTALYRATFQLPAIAAAEWELNLGDVRESARVRINGRDTGTIFAIPYTAHVGEYLQVGENTIEIEVTNLPANRIADYDRRGVQWRIFKDINIVNWFYTPMQYDIWETVPSGLLGPVTLTPLASVF
jgi:hypothetical protein